MCFFFFFLEIDYLRSPDPSDTPEVVGTTPIHPISIWWPFAFGLVRVCLVIWAFGSRLQPNPNLEWTRPFPRVPRPPEMVNQLSKQHLKIGISVKFWSRTVRWDRAWTLTLPGGSGTYRNRQSTCSMLLPKSYAPVVRSTLLGRWDRAFCRGVDFQNRVHHEKVKGILMWLHKGFPPKSETKLQNALSQRPRRVERTTGA